jgi:hypothetical protein
VENSVVKAMDNLIFEVTLDQGDDEAKASRMFEGVLLQGQTARPANNFWTLDAAGNVTHAIKIEKPIQLPLKWNIDGSAWFLVATDPRTKKSVLAHLTDQGNLDPTAEEAFTTKAVESDLEVSAVAAQAKHGKEQVEYQSLWLHSRTAVDHGEMLLAADGAWPALSPTGGGVFYIDSGVAKVRELIPLTAEQQRAAHEQPKTVELASSLGQLFHLTFVTTSAARPPQP